LYLRGIASSSFEWKLKQQHPSLKPRAIISFLNKNLFKWHCINPARHCHFMKLNKKTVYTERSSLNNNHKNHFSSPVFLSSTSHDLIRFHDFENEMIKFLFCPCTEVQWWFKVLCRWDLRKLKSALI
jgi:hypothetical protein